MHQKLLRYELLFRMQVELLQAFTSIVALLDDVDADCLQLCTQVCARPRSQPLPTEKPSCPQSRLSCDCRPGQIPQLLRA